MSWYVKSSFVNWIGGSATALAIDTGQAGGGGMRKIRNRAECKQFRYEKAIHERGEDCMRTKHIHLHTRDE